MAQKRKSNTFDYTFVTIILILICFGLVMLYSTSYYSAQLKFEDDAYFFKHQAKVSILSFVAMFIVSKVNYHWIVRLAPLWLLGSYGLMMLVRFSPLGEEIYGAKRWLSVPFVGTIQPSEITKIAMIVFVTYLVCKREREVNTIKGVGSILIWAVISGGLTFFLTDHLSAAIIIFGIAYGMVYVATMKSKLMGFAAIAGTAGLLIGAKALAKALESTKNFRLERLLMWNDPEKYLEEGGRQILQGLYAIGSGGFFGKGLGNSSQKLGFIPEAQNDWILSIICEELGVFGVIMLLGMFVMLLRELMKIAKEATDLAGSLLVTGIFSHIALQVLLNICVVTNTIPATGITLPFVSFGGSALLFLMVEMGLALNVSEHTRKARIKEESFEEF